MYFNYAFLLTDFHKNNFIPDIPKSNSIVLPVNKALWEERIYYIQKLNATSTKFCFGFFEAEMGWESAELNSIRDSLSLYFFLPNYVKKGGAYLLVSDLSTGRGNDVMNTIAGLLETQGITPLSKNYTIFNNHISNFNKDYYYDSDLIKAFDNESSFNDFSAIFRKIVFDNGVNKQLTVPIKNKEDFERKQNLILSFEEWLGKNETAYMDLVSVYKKITDGYLKLEVENKNLRFKLDNHNDYLNAMRKIAAWHVNEYHRILREQQGIMQQYGTSVPINNRINTSSMYYGSDEALQRELEYVKSNRDNIKEWYEKEYEVLPLWYKRFGHIIKVMTGKRSFKSLYK